LILANLGEMHCPPARWCAGQAVCRRSASHAPVLPRRVIDRDNDLPPFCRRGLLMGPNGGAVDHLDVAIMRGADSVHQPIPDTGPPPSHKVVVTGGAPRPLSTQSRSLWVHGLAKPWPGKPALRLSASGHSRRFWHVRSGDNLGNAATRRSAGSWFEAAQKLPRDRKDCHVSSSR
jgi:hypothetical protein